MDVVQAEGLGSVDSEHRHSVSALWDDTCMVPSTCWVQKQAAVPWGWVRLPLDGTAFVDHDMLQSLRAACCTRTVQAVRFVTAACCSRIVQAVRCMIAACCSCTVQAVRCMIAACCRHLHAC